MAVAPYIRRLRQLVGHELLVLPGVAVLPRDRDGRVLLVRIVDTGQWAAIGGAVEPDESPEEAALREAEEEAGVTLELGAVLGVLGGHSYRMTYPNGDRTSYVSTVFDARIVGGRPAPDGDETSDVRWWHPASLPVEQMSPFTRALVEDVGLVRGGASSLTAPAQPLLVVATGLPGTGKSTMAERAAQFLDAPLLAHDWAMSALRPYPALQAAMDSMEPSGHRMVGWSILCSMARAQLRRGSSVVLDGVAGPPEVERCRRTAEAEGGELAVVLTECPDEGVHRSRIEVRRRGIPDWYELDWAHVQESRARWTPPDGVGLCLSATDSVEANARELCAFISRERRPPGIGGTG